MNRIYLDRAQNLWVEATPEAIVVSWPHGHKALEYEVAVPDLLAVIRTAVDDLLADRPTEEQMREQYDEGFDAGWSERGKATP